MRRRWGLVLSGGGARGAFQVGVLERLLQDPEFESGPVAISGTSAGGINAALLAAGKSPAEMRQFWRDIAADPPVVVNAQLFEDALRTIADLIGEDSLDVFGGGPALRRFVQRAQNHVPPRLGSMLALVTEYVLTSRFDLVGRFLGGLRHSALADTSRLRARLVEVFGGETDPRTAVPLRDQHGRRPHGSRDPLRHRGDVAHARAGLPHRAGDHGRHGAREREHPAPLPAGARARQPAVGRRAAREHAARAGRRARRGGDRDGAGDAHARGRVAEAARGTSARRSSAPSIRCSRTPTTSTGSCSSRATASRGSRAAIARSSSTRRSGPSPRSAAPARTSTSVASCSKSSPPRDGVRRMRGWPPDRRRTTCPSPTRSITS